MPSYVYQDTLLVVFGLCLFLFPLFASVFFIRSFDTCRPRHQPKSSELQAVHDEQVLTFQELHINYTKFRIKEPNFIDPLDRKLFLLHKNNLELLQPRQTELLHGIIEVVPNGYVNGDIVCGWQTNSSHFLVHPKRVREHYPVLCPLLVHNANTFQHFMDGVLPKLAQIHASTSFSEVTYLLHRPWDRSVDDIIKHINLTSERVAFYDGGHFTADYLINACVAPPLHPDLFAQVRHMLAIGAEDMEFHNNGLIIILTRQGARNGGRAIVNNDALIHFLHERYRDKLFVCHGNLSFSECRALFGQAKVVIGVHGGAFYNILLAHSKLHVVEIMPVTDKGDVVPSYLGHTIIWSIADMLNHTYCHLNSKAQNSLGNVYVDLGKVAKILAKVDSPQLKDHRTSL